jgi:hypothetical protein
MKHVVSTLFTTAFVSLLPCYATSSLEPDTERFFVTLGAHINKKLALDNMKPADAGKVRVFFDKNTGLVRKIDQLNSGTNAQAQANIIDAAITEPPLNTNFSERNYLQHDIIFGDFKKQDGQKNNFSGVVKLHRIPLAVLDRYPTLFTSSELLADENTFSLKLHGDLSKQLLQVRAPWCAFFQSNPTATRDQIMQMANDKSH